MSGLSHNDFDTFFEELYGYTPYRWQSRLCEQVLREGWPDFMNLPTGSGKTSVLEIAVFTLAAQAHLPPPERHASTRIFFVIDRRIVVDEADRRAMNLAERLAEPDYQEPIIGKVAEALKQLATSDGRNTRDCVPLETHTLRGGFYRTNSWASSMVQPMIITSTVDQVGSRLLFRGYGVSPTARPLQAALVGTDSIIILDEAHTALPMGETVDSIRGYQSHAAKFGDADFVKPLRMVQMTATLPPEATSKSETPKINSVFALDPSVDLVEDGSPMVRCYKAEKRIKLDVAKSAKGKKAESALAKNLLGRVEEVVVGDPLAVGVVVNRVATAKHLYEALRESKKISATNAEVHLMVGRMRPVDRDVLGRLLGEKLATGKRNELDRPIIVVATQCLEVGADLDFDHMISEAASLDALRQRFGRLNRGGRPIGASGEVVIRADQDLTDKHIGALKFDSDADPVYGTSLVHTFRWLQDQSRQAQSVDGEDNYSVDFGLEAMDRAWASVPIKKDAAADQTYREQLLIDQPDRVALMPAHVDLLSQTYVHFVQQQSSNVNSDDQSNEHGKGTLKPVTVHPDPDVSVFLHGRTRRSVDVAVCWRADLCTVAAVDDGDKVRHVLAPAKDESVVAAVSEAPPSSAECISVSMKAIKEFLHEEFPGQNDQTDASAVETETLPAKQVLRQRRPVVWRGPDHSFVCTSTSELRPGDTLVFPLSVGGWSLLGHVPDVNVDPVKSPYDLKDPQTRAELISVDVADLASLAATWKPRLRLHPLLEESNVTKIREILASTEEQQWTNAEDCSERLNQFIQRTTNERLKTIAEFLRDRVGQTRMRNRSSGVGESATYIGDRLDRKQVQQLQGRESVDGTASDDFHDDTSTASDRTVLLSHHLQRVQDRAHRTAEALGLPQDLAANVARAASLHDIGKAEPRFQSVLFGGSSGETWMRPHLLAKSKRSATSQKERQADYQRANLPKGFRHELLSVELLHDSEDYANDTIMHLIAAHHGHGRPWFPAWDDPEPTDVSLRRIGVDCELNQINRHIGFETRCRIAVAERFWKLQRLYGAWGTVFLESTLRIADQQISREEAEGLKASENISLDIVQTPCQQTASSSIELSGLDGSNPLALLASLGLLWLVNQKVQSDAFRMHWEVSEGAWRPVLTGPEEFDRDWLVGFLDELADRDLPTALSLLDEKYQDDGSFAKGAGKITPSPGRFHYVAKQMLEQLFTGETSADQCNFVPSLGSEGSRKRLAGKETDSIEHSQLYMTKGSGHQRMLELMRNVHQELQPSHLEKALFKPWVYDDSGQSLNFRWDPADDRKYALRWKNPSSDPGMTVMGASDLAIESLVFFPTAIVNQRLETTGFEFTRRKGTFWSWPLWVNPLSVDLIRSLLQWSELHFQVSSDTRLSQIGVSVVQRVERKRNDKYFNFSAAETV